MTTGCLWQDISTAPTTGPDILLTYGGEACVIGHPNGDGTFDDGDYFHCMEGFTHWMPLPAPPRSRTL